MSTSASDAESANPNSPIGGNDIESLFLGDGKETSNKKDVEQNTEQQYQNKNDLKIPECWLTLTYLFGF